MPDMKPTARYTPFEERYKQLRRYSKRTLVDMHISNGGIMGLAVYMGWRKDELITVVMQDEGYRGT